MGKESIHDGKRCCYGLASSGQYLQFFPDRTFIDHLTDKMLIPRPYYDHPRTQRGTYSIQNQTIIFNFTHGHRGMRAPSWRLKRKKENQAFDWISSGIDSLY